MGHLSEFEPLLSRHSFGVTAYSRYFFETDDPAELFDLCGSEKYMKLPRLVLGAGSNILFTKDFPGLIVHPAGKKIELISDSHDEVIIEVEAGYNWDELVAWTVSRAYAGLENLSLIPGSVGAAPVQNIGAYGVEAKDLILEVQVLDLKQDKSYWLTKQDCHFAYRSSIFKSTDSKDLLVWAVRFKLSKKHVLKLQYHGLAAALEEIPNPGIQDLRAAVIGIRSTKLPDPDHLGNAGSFFKNPVIDWAQLKQLQKQFPDLPHYPDQENKSAKVPAAWLIESCGFKSHRSGDAGVYPRHALVLINYGSATGEELLQLSRTIEMGVQQKFEIRLEREVLVV